MISSPVRELCPPQGALPWGFFEAICFLIQQYGTITANVMRLAVLTVVLETQMSHNRSCFKTAIQVPLRSIKIGPMQFNSILLTEKTMFSCDISIFFDEGLKLDAVGCSSTIRSLNYELRRMARTGQRLEFN